MTEFLSFPISLNRIQKNYFETLIYFLMLDFRQIIPPESVKCSKAKTVGAKNQQNTLNYSILNTNVFFFL